MPTDFESLVSKVREVRTILLQAGQGVEFEEKRQIAALELTEKIVVFRELVIQGKFQVGPRISEWFKTKNYYQFLEALEAYRSLGESESPTSSRRAEIKGRIVGFIEDFLLST